MILSYVYCFSRTASKVLMQINFVSPYMLIFLFGIVGLIISLGSGFVSYFIDYPDNFINYYSDLGKLLDTNNKYRFYVKLEYEMEDDQEKFENEREVMEEEYIDDENNGLKKKDLNCNIYKTSLPFHNKIYLTKTYNFIRKSSILKNIVLLAPLPNRTFFSGEY